MRHLLRITSLLLLVCPSFSVFSQNEIALDDFSVINFTPAPGSGNYLATDGARMAEHLSPTAGITFDYSQGLFTLFEADCNENNPDNCDLGDVDTKLVDYAIVNHLHGSISLFRRFQIGLVVPLVLVQKAGYEFRESADELPTLSIPGGSKFGLGDIRLHLKGRIWGGGADGSNMQGLHIAAAAYVSAPMGQLTSDNSFIGDSSPVVGGHAIVEYVLGDFRVAGNLGGEWRQPQTFLATTKGSRFLYKVGAGYDFVSWAGVLAEMDGATAFNSNLDENLLETRLAGQFRVGDFSFDVGAGVGALYGAGVPLFRTLLQAQWAPTTVDSDGDGIVDREDACKNEPEDRDGFEDTDGCPEDDNDGDGLDDLADQCPLDPEDKDGFQDEDGCPDTDNDNDGIPDGFDSCPDDPEDKDGDQDEDGCPDNDQDGDGIPDDQDQCPTEAEDTDGFGDLDGCPEVDFDNDGIPDDEDECPEEPEDKKRGSGSKDGCPG